jgi:3-oxoacyl-[acyl-carrier protein] reductase
MEKNNKVAIVTGASGGIGRAVAIRLARDGFAVVAHYSGNAEKAEEVVAEIKAGGGRAIAVRANVAVVADVERLFKEAVDAFGAIEVVVNCAGIMPLAKIADGDNVVSFLAGADGAWVNGQVLRANGGFV